MYSCGYKKQWSQLLVLSAIHFIVDMAPGAIVVLQPQIQNEFSLTFRAVCALTVILHCFCNIIQLFSGAIRPEKTTVFFLPVGAALAMSVCFIGFVPLGGIIFVKILIVYFICGFGVALVHPEGFRAIHALDKISPSISTAVFVNGGILGFGMGGWLATILVDGGFLGLDVGQLQLGFLISGGGLRHLAWIAPFAVILIILI